MKIKQSKPKLSPLMEEAANNLITLMKNSYPGRGIVVGMDETGKNLVQVYWIMGRSENSRNRIFVANKSGTLKTKPADPSQVKKGDANNKLIFYTAMKESCRSYAVSNGDQTGTALVCCGYNSGLGHPLFTENWEYEPDVPNYTPRITATCLLFNDELQTVEMSVLRKSRFDDWCDHYHYQYKSLAPGLGYCIHTYAGDGDPLPSFRGEPYLLPLHGGAGGVKQIMGRIWGALNKDNRVAIAIKAIDLKTGKSKIEIINKYKPV